MGPVAQDTSIFFEESAVFIRRAPKEPRLIITVMWDCINSRVVPPPEVALAWRVPNRGGGTQKNCRWPIGETGNPHNEVWR
jgi:hypothetical protein